MHGPAGTIAARLHLKIASHQSKSTYRPTVHPAMMMMMMIAETMDAPDSLTHSLARTWLARCVPLARFWHDEKSSSVRRTRTDGPRVHGGER